MNIIAEGKSICGGKTVNEDSFFLNEMSALPESEQNYNCENTDGSPLCFAVADGVSGAYDGENASNTAILSVAASFEAWRYKRYDSGKSVQSFIKHVFKKANDDVVQMSRVNMPRSGTTLTLLLLQSGKYFLANVGDSPAYLIRGKAMIQLHDEQTLGAYIEHKLGRKPTREESNTLMSFLGNTELGGDESVHITSGSYRDGDTFLICTDGITKIFSNKEICKLIRRNRHRIIDRLFEKAMARDPKDNCTGVVIRVGNNAKHSLLDLPNDLEDRLLQLKRALKTCLERRDSK